MSKPGRKPKPAELRLLEGNREHRRIPETVKPKVKRIPAPHWLHPEAKKEWKRMVRELQPLGLFTVIDKVALEAYCQLYAKWKAAEQKAELHIFETDSGYKSINPYINVALKYAKEMRAYLVEFGMTPSARTRVNVDKLKDEAAEWDELLASR